MVLLFSSKVFLCVFVGKNVYAFGAYFTNEIGCLKNTYCKASHNKQGGEIFPTR